MLCALVAPWPLIAFTALSAASIAAIQAAVALAALSIALNERVRIGLVPSTIRRHRVRDAASREFDARGLAGTQGRTGVLVYMALAERHAEIVADEAVRARIPDEAWGEVLAALTEAAGRGALGPGLLAAVGRVGALLAEALPAGPNRNELPNRVVLLD
nr:TPM domain-containing protein [Methylobacterium brachythecii]